MQFLGYAYRFASNFVFLALVYYSLNLIEKYPQRAMLAVLILIYAGMHSASALRSFYFFQRPRSGNRPTSHLPRRLRRSSRAGRGQRDIRSEFGSSFVRRGARRGVGFFFPSARRSNDVPFRSPISASVSKHGWLSSG